MIGFGECSLLMKKRLRKRVTKGVLTAHEESHLVQYLIEICNRELGLSPTQLKIKVYEMIRTKWTPFKNGKPGSGWMWWWKRCHPELSLRSSQALETTRENGLCKENVASFYKNLENLASTHDYPPSLDSSPRNS